MDLLDIDEALSDGEISDSNGDDGIQRLVEGLNLKSLATSGSEFSVQVNEEAAFEEQLSYDGPKVFDHLNMECIGEGEDNESGSANPGDTPFATLAKKMTDLTPDGKVKKRILTEGYGEVVPPKALIWFHYDSYIEMVDVPIDSSYLRGKACMIRINCGQTIVGLDIGLSTMKREEKAEFLLHPDYAYGKMGIPPRIPAESYVLIRVELKKFVDNALALKMGEYTEEELKCLPFEEICKGALALLQEGKHAFNMNKYHHAAQLYRKAIQSLENCDMKCDNDDAKNEALRLRLYINLAVTLNKIGSTSSSKQAIVACRKALALNQRGAKAHYNCSLAHLRLGGADEAKRHALLARKYAPQDTMIGSLLQKIDQQMKKYQNSCIAFARNAFRSLGDKENLGVGKAAVGKAALTAGKASASGSRPLDDVTFSQGPRNGGSVKIVEILDEEPKQSPQSAKNKETGKAHTLSTENSSTLDNGFELETIGYIQEFFDDPLETRLVVPSGLTYEEEMFFKKQANLFGLLWEERQDVDTGKTVVYILK